MAELNPQAMKDLAELTIAMANNPATRDTFTEMVGKVTKPGAYTFPDVEAKKGATAAARLAAKEELEAERAERDKAQRLADMNAQRAKLINSGKFTDETIKSLETFMTAKGYGSYDDAAILYAHENPPATPRPDIATAGQFEMPSLKDWNNPRKTALAEAYKYVDESVRKRA